MSQQFNPQIQRLAQQLAEPIWPWIARLFLAADEGSYTPTYTGGTTAGVTTYTVQLGRWRRVGDVLHVWGAVAWSAATGTGNARISLPFAHLNVSGFGSPVLLRLSGVTYAGDSPQGIIAANTNYVEIEGVTSNAGATKSAVEAAGALLFSATYLTE